MYFSSEEEQAIAYAVTRLRKNFPFYGHAMWFDGWDDLLIRDAALCCEIADAQTQGTKVKPETYTALAKMHYTLTPENRFIVICDLPTKKIGGSIARLARIYREHHYGFAGDWAIRDHEITVAALANGRNYAAPVRPASFTDLLSAVRLQLSCEMVGTCRCGIRKSREVCAICGMEGKR